jgi:hypothetical protein
MADNEFSLHVDTDWKKQAQEEKRKLAEEQAKKAAAPAPAGTSSMTPADPRGVAAGARKGRRDLPAAGFGTLVNSIMTQVLYYLGDLGQGEAAQNLDMAKYQLDTLGVIEEKTAGNLLPDEQKLLDAALYETRTRFIGVASQHVNF